MTNLYNENTLVQQTTADYLEQELGLDSVYAYNNEDFGPDSLRVFDFEHPDNNHFLCVRELWVRGDLYRRRADIVGFVSALTLVFMVRKDVTLPASIFYAVYFQMDDGKFVIGRNKTCN
jgi:type I site-specific restriction-modification system R (restriction) subunit